MVTASKTQNQDLYQALKLLTFTAFHESNKPLNASRTFLNLHVKYLLSSSPWPSIPPSPGTFQGPTQTLSLPQSLPHSHAQLPLYSPPNLHVPLSQYFFSRSGKHLCNICSPTVLKPGGEGMSPKPPVSCPTLLPQKDLVICCVNQWLTQPTGAASCPTCLTSSQLLAKRSRRTYS